MGDDDEIQKADPAARARLLSWLIPLALAGLLLAAALTTLSEQLVNSAPLQWVYGLLGLLVVLGLVMLWPLRVVWRTGQAAVAARRFPPPGEPVVRDTPVRHGADAVLRGRILQSFAVTLAAFVLLTPAAIAWLLRVRIG